jgi:hypothetical protein
VTIDNKTISGQPTVLPSFGGGTAQAGTSGATVVVDRVAWPGTYFAGHWVEVTTALGAPKGTWRIGSVINSPAQRTVPGSPFGIPLQDGNVYDGYLIYSDITLAAHAGIGANAFQGLENAHVFGARFSGGQWQYDNNSSFVTFTPDASDRVFATYKGGVSNIVRLTCPRGVCGVVNGLPVLQLVAGDITPNFDPGSQNPGEIWVHDLVFASTLASFTLVPNGAESIDVQPGDHYQGVYQFDVAPSVTGGATLTSIDPIRIGGTLLRAEPTNLADAVPAGELRITSVSLCSDNFGPLKPGSSFAVCADTDARDVTLEISGAFDVRIAGYGNCRAPIAIPGSAKPGPLRVVATARDAEGRTASASMLGLVVADELAPVLVSVEPPTGAAFRSGEPLRVAVETWDDVAIASVAITLGGQKTILTVPPYELLAFASPVVAETAVPALVEVFDPSGNVSRRALDLRVLSAGARQPAVAAAPAPGVSFEGGRLAMDGGWPWRDADGETRGRTLELQAIGTHTALAVDGANGAVVALDGPVAPAAVHGGAVDVRRGSELVGRFRIEAVSEDGLVLRLEGSAAGKVREGDFLEGNWAFDSIELTRGAILRAVDAVEAGSVHVDASSLFLSKNLQIPFPVDALSACPARGSRPDPPGTAPSALGERP